MADAATARTLAGWRGRPLSDAIQDYLREIYKLGGAGDRVRRPRSHAEGVSPASACAMVKKLAALPLAVHAPYKGASLTPEGERVALEVIRHHRLLELYLAETLGIQSTRSTTRPTGSSTCSPRSSRRGSTSALGFPTHDPHGDPIPDANLEWPAGVERD